MAISCLFLLIPAISNISIRQIPEMAVSLSLSLVSFVLLLLAVFLGGTTIWRDIERRYTFSVLGLPMSRSAYLMGRFLGVVLCILLAAAVLGAGAIAAIKLVSSAYPPDRPLLWFNILLALSFDTLKYILLVALSFLFSSLSTSFFLPVFGTISFFWLGTVSQQVYDYLHSPIGAATSPFVRQAANLLYYVIPNFTSFNLKSQAVYSLNISLKGAFLTSGYFILATTILLTLSCMIFSKREFQ
jgi:ABC-type transport system involved in multi-copper enzyme maturation permease subunit